MLLRHSVPRSSSAKVTFFASGVAREQPRSMPCGTGPRRPLPEPNARPTQQRVHRRGGDLTAFSACVDDHIFFPSRLLRLFARRGHRWPGCQRVPLTVVSADAPALQPILDLSGEVEGPVGACDICVHRHRPQEINARSDRAAVGFRLWGRHDIQDCAVATSAEDDHFLASPRSLRCMTYRQTCRRRSRGKFRLNLP